LHRDDWGSTAQYAGDVNPAAACARLDSVSMAAVACRAQGGREKLVPIATVGGCFLLALLVTSPSSGGSTVAAQQAVRTESWNIGVVEGDDGWWAKLEVVRVTSLGQKDVRTFMTVQVYDPPALGLRWGTSRVNATDIPSFQKALKEIAKLVSFAVAGLPGR